MNHAYLFIAIGLVCLFSAHAAGGFLGFLLRLNFAAALLGAGIGYAAKKPKIFLKRADGSFPWYGWAAFWPYFLINEISLVGYRWLAKEGFAAEILPGLFLGSRPLPFDAAYIEQIKVRSVLDLTCELQETAFMRQAEAYRCIPVLDATAPTRAQLDEGVAWIRETLKRGPVYVHCAMGHGRSATFIAAHILTEKLAGDVEAAMEIIRGKRPGAKLNAEQHEFLSGIYEEGKLGEYDGGTR
ncbi:MAG: dual specificity protein phosphatase family protein [Elusimicrobiota bacterium]